MIEVLTGLPVHTVGFKLSGKLHDEDYKKFVPLVDAEIARDGKVNVLAQFHDFHGWDAKALWDDIRFSTTHCTKIKRIALVGEKTWEEWMEGVQAVYDGQDQVLRRERDRRGQGMARRTLRALFRLTGGLRLSGLGRGEVKARQEKIGQRDPACKSRHADRAAGRDLLRQ